PIVIQRYQLVSCIQLHLEFHPQNLFFCQSPIVEPIVCIHSVKALHQPTSAANEQKLSDLRFETVNNDLSALQNGLPLINRYTPHLCDTSENIAHHQEYHYEFFGFYRLEQPVETTLGYNQMSTRRLHHQSTSQPISPM